MKLIQTLLAAILLLSVALPLAAQPTTKQPPTAPQKHRRPIARRRQPVKPTTPSLVVTLPSGLSYVITKLGEGRQPLPGEKVSVNYTGVTSNGIKFDSSLDRGRPFSFELGKGQVIKGWDEGIGKLRVGTQATFIIPPQLAYGEKGRGPIPPNATLIFIVELMGIEDKPPTP
jgi:peptidylprolyl isomerase